ncbi:MAG TPA: ribosome maturation factor RimM [Gemmatimonadaceae bacterium]|jgi:16S rRNA processing protein RimM|nr:ribosome maturation factor RimM [Gemmatimonadaceae bacterium]
MPAESEKRTPGLEPESLVIVGRVRKAHGIRGEVVVEPLTDDPDAVFAHGRRLIAGTVSGDPSKDRRELHVESAGPFKGGLIVRFGEIADRTAAETWRDRYLLAPAAELEPPGEDQVYVHEIPGMRVELASGGLVGTVAATYDLPQGLMLDVEREGGTILVPYDRVVISLDREARVIRIDPPEGLLD